MVVDDNTPFPREAEFVHEPLRECYGRRRRLPCSGVVVHGLCLDLGRFLRVMVVRRLVQVEVAEDSDVANE